MEEKRERKRKKSYSQKAEAEWDELAAEEAAYKKFKKGKISKSEYVCLLQSLRGPLLSLFIAFIRCSAVFLAPDYHYLTSLPPSLGTKSFVYSTRRMTVTTTAN